MNKNILFTDIVGYSKLTGDDQSLALELLKEHDQIIEPIINKYKGQVVKRIGDAIVAIFDDTESMIQVSIEIQQSLKNRNNRNIKSRQLVLRIGLHYGDIIIQDDEIHGLGYDLASEIEPICEYGGIAISESVYSQSHENNEFIIKGINNHFFIRPIAEFNFTASPEPILIYKLYLNLLDWYDESHTDVYKYLLDQHIADYKYSITNISKNKNDLDHHLDSGHSFLNVHNLSYAIYHYKMYLDYSQSSDYDNQFLILKIFSECGLVRLVDTAIKQSNFNDHKLILLINGINLFNQKKWDKAFTIITDFLNSDYTNYQFDGLYYLLTILYKQKKYDSIIDLIDSKNHITDNSSIHSLILPTIREIALFQIGESTNSSIDNLSNKFDQYLSSINLLNDKRYALFLYYPLIIFHQKNTTIENAINIQNKAITLIRECKSAISGFLLKQLFLKNPIIHQLIMEPLELEFVDDEGLDDYDFDDVITNQKEISKFCVSCGFKNNIEFKFCISCGKKLVS